jgi:hypothetical protein
MSAQQVEQLDSAMVDARAELVKAEEDKAAAIREANNASLLKCSTGY